MTNQQPNQQPDKQEEFLTSIKAIASAVLLPAQALIVIDPNSKILYSVKTMDFFSFKPEELEQKSLNMILPGFILTSHQNYVTDFCNGGFSEQVMAAGRKIKARSKDNKEVEIYVQIRKFEISGQMMLGAVCTKASSSELIGFQVQTESYMDPLSADSDKFISRANKTFVIVGRVADYIGTHPLRSLLAFFLLASSIIILVLAWKLTTTSVDIPKLILNPKE